MKKVIAALILTGVLLAVGLSDSKDFAGDPPIGMSAPVQPLGDPPIGM